VAPTLIAHRGAWWPHREDENSLHAVERAFERGYDAEIDVRWLDAAGRCLVLSHDRIESRPRTWPFPPLLDDILRILAQYPNRQLFINIKEPTTVASIAELTDRKALCDRVWLFDFGLCQADPWAAKKSAPATLRCLSRVSDREEAPEAAGDWASGFWFDQWDSDWVTREKIDALSRHGPVFLVSSELHQRTIPVKRLVTDWRYAAGVCTDVPHLFQALLTGQPELTPENPWWNP
jgi:glycerophosphoryl diester phosphodiesterase